MHCPTTIHNTQCNLNKITHTWRRWGTPQNFSFGIYWWTLKNPKNQIFEKINNNNKNCWRYHHFTYLYQKPQSYEVKFLWYWVRQKIFLILGQFFASPSLPSPPDAHTPCPNNPENQKLEKCKKLLKKLSFYTCAI